VCQVAETLSEEALGKMGAPPKNAEIPVLDPNDLAKAGAPCASLRALCYVSSSNMDPIRALFEST